MSFIEVKNKKGTAERDVPEGCNSWLDFWEKRKDKKATECEVMSCNGEADLGGHVIKINNGSKEYILPMCVSCNKKEDAFKAWENDLVSVK